MSEVSASVPLRPGDGDGRALRRGAGSRPTARQLQTAAAIVAAASLLWLQRGHLGEVPSALAAVGSASPSWLVVAVVASAVSYVMGALAMTGTVDRSLPFLQNLQVQVASGFVTLAAPAGLGSAGMNVWFLERIGVPRRESVAAALRNGIAGGLVHVVGLAVVLVHLPDLVDVDAVAVRRLSLQGGGVLAAVLLVAVLVGWWRRDRLTQLAGLVADGWRGTASLLRRRDRAWPLLGGSLGLTLTYGVALWACARAVGIHIDLPTAIAVEVVVQTFGALGGTPGGVGVVEAAGLQGLLLAGARPSQALAAVLLHRLVTFWFPVVPGALALRRLRATFASGR